MIIKIKTDYTYTYPRFKTLDLLKKFGEIKKSLKFEKFKYNDEEYFVFHKILLKYKNCDNQKYLELFKKYFINSFDYNNEINIFILKQIDKLTEIEI